MQKKNKKTPKKQKQKNKDKIVHSGMTNKGASTKNFRHVQRILAVKGGGLSESVKKENL